MTEQSTPTTVAEIWELFREVAEQSKETALRFKETDLKFKETDQSLRRLEGLFTSQWGKLLEALVQPSALKLFRERGIEVHYTYSRVKSQQGGDTMELDILLENGKDVIVVEAKTTLRVRDVDEFLVDLADFRRFFPRYAGYHVYGAIAGLQIDENSDRYTYKQGLFVLSVIGEGVVQIKNDDTFRPRDFQFGVK